jgi:hypothetical protein
MKGNPDSEEKKDNSNPRTHPLSDQYLRTRKFLALGCGLLLLSVFGGIKSKKLTDTPRSFYLKMDYRGSLGIAAVAILALLADRAFKALPEGSKETIGTLPQTPAVETQPMIQQSSGGLSARIFDSIALFAIRNYMWNIGASGFFSLLWVLEFLKIKHAYWKIQRVSENSKLRNNVGVAETAE